LLLQIILIYEIAKSIDNISF